MKETCVSSALCDFQQQLVRETRKAVELEFPHKSGIALRPGGTPEISRRWNRRDRDPKTREPRKGDRPKLVCRPSGAGNISLLDSGGYAPLHHRLISAAPPAQKTCVETLARPLCAMVSQSGGSLGLLLSKSLLVLN